MIKGAEELIRDFVITIRNRYSINVSEDEIVHEHLEAPHVPTNLPVGKAAVYVFSMPANSIVPAGPNRALKVGKAGPNSNARFQYQHYKSGSANSTLAGAIENNLVLQSYIGLDQTPRNVGSWIQKNIDRDNFFVDGLRKDLLSLLEVYLKGRLGPIFEGSLSTSGLTRGSSRRGK